MREMVNAENHPNIFQSKKAHGNLVFDDESVTPLLYGRAPAVPTPANILELWQTDNSEIVSFDAVVSVLENRPELTSTIQDTEKMELLIWDALENSQAAGQCKKAGNLFVVLAKTCRLNGRDNIALSLQRRAVEIRKKTEGANHAKTLQATEGLIVLLETLGKQQEAAAIRILRNMDRLFSKGDQNSLLTLRNLAYDLFEKGDFREAEHVYRRLLEKRFEVPGTLSHLARALLAIPGVDNRKEARSILKKAWERRCDAPSYVPPRILLWKTMLNMLDRKDSADTIGMLKFALQKENVFLDYSVSHVLDRWKASLAAENFLLLDSLASTLSGKDKPAALKGHPAWRKQTPIPFEFAGDDLPFI